ncbi:hypothetical protein GXM_06107 [Nostoc sphaeroides CCNUC1]|uniref:Uncharacterized protein n=1 Tax=Nostoc sphaeroides CCNUC1 TaxID=2653204 RepID=A0A5P8W764_9NOSO|nr:hypothetical protein GXM_06107 [Nostoc sphaeroides CCNUC1]
MLCLNTVQLRIFGTNFRPVETRNFASLPRFLGLTELYCVMSAQLQFKGRIYLIPLIIQFGTRIYPFVK